MSHDVASSADQLDDFDYFRPTENVLSYWFVAICVLQSEFSLLKITQLTELSAIAARRHSASLDSAGLAQIEPNRLDPRHFPHDQLARNGKGSNS